MYAIRSYYAQTLSISDSQRYLVSDFAATDLYAAEGKPRHTYIYSAPVTSLANPGTRNNFV